MSWFCRIWLVCGLLLLGACSSTTFLYNRLDFILPWYLGDYVHLDRPQKKQLDQLLEPFLDWHRRHELPRYLVLIESIEQSLDRPWSGDDVQRIAIDIEAAWYRLEARVVDWLLIMGESLSEQQMADFLERLQEQQLEYEEEYLSRSDLKASEESCQRLLDNMQDFLGRLNGEQRDLLRTACGQLLRSDHAWLAERAAWLGRLEVLLQREPGWQQRLRQALDQRDENLTPEYRQAYQHNLGLINAVIAAVLNSRTDKQDRRLRRKLANWREDLQVLIGQNQHQAAQFN